MLCSSTGARTRSRAGRLSEHTVEEEWAIEGERVAFVQGSVTYCLPDGRSVSIPFLNLFRLRGEKIAEYRVYVDPTPLAG